MHLRAVLFVWVSTSVSALERTDFIAFTGCYVSNGFASEPYGNLTWCGMGLLCIDTTCQSNTYSNSWIYAQSCTDIFNSDAYQYDYDGDSYTCEDNPDFPPICQKTDMITNAEVLTVMTLLSFGGILGAILLFTLNGCSLVAPSDLKNNDRIISMSQTKSDLCCGCFPETSCCIETRTCICEKAESRDGCEESEWLESINDDIGDNTDQAESQEDTLVNQLDKSIANAIQAIGDDVADEFGFVWGNFIMLSIRSAIDKIKNDFVQKIDQKASDDVFEMKAQLLKPIFQRIVTFRRIKNAVDFFVFELGKKALVFVPLLLTANPACIAFAIDIIVLLYFGYYGAYCPGSMYNRLHVIITGKNYPRVVLTFNDVLRILL